MIKFPRMHIAESVVNRILNVADGIPDQGSGVEQPRPAVPETELTGAQLNRDLSQPLGPLPGLDAAPDPGATAAGDPLLKTMLKPGR